MRAKFTFASYNFSGFTMISHLCKVFTMMVENNGPICFVFFLFYRTEDALKSLDDTMDRICTLLESPELDWEFLDS